MKVKKDKGLSEEKDEFDLMDGNQKSLVDRLGTSPEDIEKKMNAKRKGMYVTVGTIKNLIFLILIFMEEVMCLCSSAFKQL